MSGEQGRELTPLEEVQFAMILLDNARRTVVCSPDAESRVKSRVDAMGIGGVITVVVNPACPDDKLWIIDENAITAASNEILSKEPITRFGRRWT